VLRLIKTFKPVLLWSALLLSAGAHASQIGGLRIWDGPDKTRAVIDLSAPVEYKLFILTSPDRVVIDLENTTLDDNAEMPDLVDGRLSGIRSGQRDDIGTRIVLDLSRPAKPSSFLLKPVGEYGHRLVIDLVDEITNLPIEAPIRKASESERDIIVAIDAGHGGEDPGAIGGKGTYEKDVVLKVSKLLKVEIDEMEGYKAILVRSGDYYLPHQQRMDKAREQRADLFISIHADGFPDKRARGTSVFVLTHRRASSEAAKWLADRNNRSDLVGGVTLDDKDDTLAMVLLDLSQSASMKASTDAGTRVHESISSVSRTHKKQLERASMIVLTSPDIPSILVETGFITNPDEEKMLNTKAYRRKLAKAIAGGVESFFQNNPPAGTWVALRSSSSKSHVVSRGETLSGIAYRYDVALTALKDVNNLSNDRVLVGSVLRLPSSNP